MLQNRTFCRSGYNRRDDAVIATVKVMAVPRRAVHWLPGGGARLLRSSGSTRTRCRTSARRLCTGTTGRSRTNDDAPSCLAFDAAAGGAVAPPALSLGTVPPRAVASASRPPIRYFPP